jgi:glycosyltransferase involved in cell wall biosynthesis
MKLSILICTLPSRVAMLGRLQADLWGQILPFAGQIEVPTPDDSIIDTIGEKRNRMLQKANGEYVCFIDDDDTISRDYVKLIMGAISSGCDCASLKGEITIDGGKPEIFEHSLKYDEWKTNPEGWTIRYERYPNHLNAIKSSIAKQFSYPEKNHGEDHDWSREVHESGLLKTEHYIPEVIYYYKYISNKKNG